MRHVIGLAALTLAACKPGDDSDSDATDTDTNDTAATCADFVFDGTIGVGSNVAVPEGDVTVGLFPWNFDTNVPDVSHAQVFANVGPLDGDTPFTMCLAPATGASPIQDGGYDARAALFLVGAWVDSNGDGVVSAEEPLVGGSTNLLGWLEGTELPADVASLGLDFGWNTVHVAPQMDGPDAGAHLTSGEAAYELPGSLLMANPPSVSGTLIPAGDAETTVALVSLQEDMGNPPPANPWLASDVVDATNAGANFTIDLPTPPADHVVDVDANGNPGVLDAAVYGAIGFADANGNEAYDDGEAVYGATFGGDSNVALVWLRPRSLLAVAYAPLFGGMGWQLALTTDPPAPYPWDNGLLLTAPPAP